MFSADQILASINRGALIAFGIVVNRKFKMVNAKFCHMLGFSEDELIGQSARMVYETQDEFERVGKEKYAMIALHGTGTIVTQWQAKDGQLVDVLLSSTPVDGANLKKGLTFTAIDITAQKAAQQENENIISTLGSVIADRTRWLNENNIKLQSEIDKRNHVEKKLRASKNKLQSTIKQLKHTQAQIIQTEKMASIGQLAAGVAHEINNPTAFVSSNLYSMAQYQTEMSQLLDLYEAITELLIPKQNQSDLPAPVKTAIMNVQQFADKIDLPFIREDFSELIKESREGTERIKKIVEDLKDFAHPGVLERQETDINKGLDAAINVVWNEIKYNTELEKDYGELPQVWCYSQQINQVFMNLLINASQSIDSNGKIYIRTRQQNGHVIVQVCDNGCGIPKEIQSQIFDPFFTTKEVGKGTGLGLSTTFNIIEKHNGSIEVNSKEGEGTSFTICLPIAQPAATEE